MIFSRKVGVDAATNQVVWQWHPDAFGIKQPVETGAEINLRFPGQYYDKPTGLYYNLNRYYDPKLGRYWEPDPLGLEAGLNPYVYAGNDPVNNVDPTGLLLVFTNGTSPKFKSDFAKVLDVARKNGLGANFDYVLNSPEIAMFSFSDRNYVGMDGDLHWNNEQGIITSAGVYISPATTLAHEMDHEFRVMKNRAEAKRLRDTPDTQYKNLLEKLAVLGAEQNMAKVLGEISGKERTRYKYEMKAPETFKVTDPLSHTPAPQQDNVK